MEAEKTTRRPMAQKKKSNSVVVSSWNEWDPLESVLIGQATGAQVPAIDKSLLAINYADQLKLAEKLVGPYPQKVIEEANEDLNNLSSELEKLGVEVLRPSTELTQQKFSNPFWSAESYYQYCPRDSVLVVGDQIIESPMPLRSRYFESFGYRDIFKKAMLGGAKWYSAPKPFLTDDCYNLENINKDKLTLNEVEPCFDAANILRCGRDLFYLVSNSGNRLGAQWLQNILGPEFKVHILEGIYSFMHIDSTISFLRPGLVLLNPERISPNKIPEPINKWDIIWCPESNDIGFHGEYKHASPWIGMNLLMLRPDLAVVEKRQLTLIRELEKHRIDVLALDIRHARTMGGGFHCVTLDLRRRGQLESYF